jgi:hypothetical protein
MVIGKADCRTAMVLANNGKVYLQEIMSPWIVEEVDTGPPDEDDEGNVIHCWPIIQRAS